MPIFDVCDKVVVITGAASGIGRAIADTMAQRKAKVALIDVDQGALEVASSELQGVADDVLSFCLDVRDRSAIRDAIDIIASKWGRLDVVFANAGIGAGGGFCLLSGERNVAGDIERVSDQTWDDVIAINLSAVFVTIQSAARHMRQQRSGRIIVTTSIASRKNESWIGTPYMPAKAGAAHLMRQAAYELAPYGINVNAIAPGAVETNIGGGRMKLASTQTAMKGKIPLGRLATPAEIAGVALFLASSASDFITGVEIPVDGGASLGRGY